MKTVKIIGTLFAVIIIIAGIILILTLTGQKDPPSSVSPTNTSSSAPSSTLVQTEPASQTEWASNGYLDGVPETNANFVKESYPVDEIPTNYAKVYKIITGNKEIQYAFECSEKYAESMGYDVNNIRARHPLSGRITIVEKERSLYALDKTSGQAWLLLKGSETWEPGGDASYQYLFYKAVDENRFLCKKSYANDTYSCWMYDLRTNTQTPLNHLMAFCAEDKTFWYTTLDGDKIAVYKIFFEENFREEKSVFSIPEDVRQKMASFAVSLDRKTVAVLADGDTDGKKETMKRFKVFIYSYDSGELLRSFDVNDRFINWQNIAFMSQNRVYISSSDKEATWHYEIDIK